MIDSCQVKTLLGATLVSLLLAPPLNIKAQEIEQAYIAIIIDDMGYNLHRGREAIAIPASLTFAVLPNSTHAASIARMAHEAGKEVMVHMPMENSASLPMGKNVLTRSQRKEEFQVILDQALDLIPHAQGVNNHMGSALTQESQAMQWFMESISDRSMYFIDSRTTAKTIAFNVARSNNLRAASRDVFLDNNPTIHAIDRSFRRLMRIARRKGTAIAIGHPYPTTLRYLDLAIPKMEGIELVATSDLIMLRQIRESQLQYQAIASD